jgi:hypothetical protein
LLVNILTPSGAKLEGELHEPENPPAPISEAEIDQLNSAEELDAKDAIECKTNSEEHDVEILGTKSGAVYLLSKKGRNLPRNTALGSTGTGKYVSVDTDEKGYQVNLSSDSDVILVEMAGLNAADTTIQAMTIYKYIVLLERTKKISKYQFSFFTASREAKNNQDGFKIASSKDMKFVTIALKDAPEKFNAKSFFKTTSKYFESVQNSKFLATRFRYRFERVQSINKINKPVICSKVPIALQAGKPFKVLPVRP